MSFGGRGKEGGERRERGGEGEGEGGGNGGERRERGGEGGRRVGEGGGREGGGGGERRGRRRRRRESLATKGREDPHKKSSLSPAKMAPLMTTPSGDFDDGRYTQALGVVLSHQVGMGDWARRGVKNFSARRKKPFRARFLCSKAKDDQVEKALDRKDFVVQPYRDPQPFDHRGVRKNERKAWVSWKGRRADLLFLPFFWCSWT